VGTPQIPKTQQDALPIQTIAQASSGDIQIVGNTMTRFWSSTVLNMGAEVSEQGVFNHYSNQLDVRGCNSFTLVVKRVTGANAQAAVANVALYWLYGSSDGVFPSLAAVPSLSTYPRMNATNGWGALGVTSTDVQQLSWTNGGVQPTNYSGAGMATVGTSFKIVLSLSVAISAAESYTFEMWGGQ
jgi:hypothetical protein